MQLHRVRLPVRSGLRATGWLGVALLGLSACTSGSTPFAQSDPGFYQELSWSPDGATLLVSVLELTDTAPGYAYRIWNVDSRGRRTPRPITDGPRDYWSSWSPDGSQIVFAALTGPAGLDIVVTDADGSERRQLTRAAGDDTQPAWSPDGSRIAFISRWEERGAIWLMDADGSNPILLVEPTAEMQNPAWSPDGRWLTYYETDGAGNDQVFLVAADGTGRRRVAAGLWPTFTPDGAALVYAAEGGLYRRPLDEGEPIPLLSGEVIAGELSPDGERLAAIVRDSTSVKVVVQAANGGSPQVLMTRPPPPW